MNEAEEITKDLEELHERLKNAALHDNHNLQTVIHKTEGLSGWMGILIGFTVATCIATWIGLILFGMDIHDLRAWRDIHSNDISMLKTQISQLKEKQ